MPIEASSPRTLTDGDAALHLALTGSRFAQACSIPFARGNGLPTAPLDDLLVFHDIAPWAPVHLLIIPKRHITTMYDTTESDAPMLGRMTALAPKLMRENGVVNGFRIVVNTGRDGMQEVQHVHMHVMGGPRPWAKG